MKDFFIDPEAKSKVELTKIDKDVNGDPYYIGKLQFPGPLEFESGVSFFVFVSEGGVEQLQIAPMDPSRKLKMRDNVYMNKGRLSIKLNPRVDQHGRTYYIGEGIGLVKLDLKCGIFFTVFVSKSGSEEIQITRLNYKARKPKDNIQPEIISLKHINYND
jgi:hypothetical protein